MTHDEIAESHLKLFDAMAGLPMWDKIEWVFVGPHGVRTDLDPEEFRRQVFEAAHKTPIAEARAREEDLPTIFEAWWNASPNKNRDVLGYGRKKSLAFDAFSAGLAFAAEREGQGRATGGVE